MKIVSYNINGIMAFCNTGKMSKLLDDYNADIYCFQEVKCGVDKTINKLINNETDEYNIYSCINKDKKGYAGVTTLVKKDIPVINIDIPEPCFGIYTGGRIVNVELDKFHIINVYSVNSGGDSDKAMSRIVFDSELIEYCKKLTKPYIIVGDLNVCSTEFDYWDNFEKSIDKGPGLMDFEIKAFQHIISECNMVDSFRMLHPGERKYSYYSSKYGQGQKSIENNKGWRLDYALISESIKDFVDSSDIDSAYNGPDHSPVILNLKY